MVLAGVELMHVNGIGHTAILVQDNKIYLNTQAVTVNRNPVSGKTVLLVNLAAPNQLGVIRHLESCLPG